MQCGYNISDISNICLSHHHLDHMADFLPLLFALNYDPALSQTASLTLLARDNFEHILDDLGRVYGKWIDPGPGVLKKLYLAPGQEHRQGEVAIKTAEARHIETSLAFRFEHRGLSLVYPGDCAYCQSLLELARGADLLIAHCGGSDEAPKPLHLNPRAAGELAREAGAKGLLLSHLYRAADRDQALHSAAGSFRGPIWTSSDFMTLELSKKRHQPRPAKARRLIARNPQRLLAPG